jgi:hypothetical protein
MYGQFLNEAEFNQRLNAFLDNELTLSEEQEFLDLLQNSPALLARFNQEKNFHEFLRSKIQRKSVSPMLVQNIKAKIQLPGMPPTGPQSTK